MTTIATSKQATTQSTPTNHLFFFGKSIEILLLYNRSKKLKCYVKNICTLAYIAY